MQRARRAAPGPLPTGRGAEYVMQLSFARRMSERTSPHRRIAVRRARIAGQAEFFPGSSS